MKIMLIIIIIIIYTACTISDQAAWISIIIIMIVMIIWWWYFDEVVMMMIIVKIYAACTISWPGCINYHHHHHDCDDNMMMIFWWNYDDVDDQYDLYSIHRKLTRLQKSSSCYKNHTIHAAFLTLILDHTCIPYKLFIRPSKWNYRQNNPNAWILLEPIYFHFQFLHHCTALILIFVS